MFDTSSILKQLQTQNLDPSLFDRIDERDIPKAPNFITWVTSPVFLNTRVLPKQVEISSKLLVDYCPTCSKPGYIDNLFDQSIGNIRDNIMFLEHGVCPKCRITRFDIVKQNRMQLRNELALAIGQRAGKSKEVGLLATYSLHRFLKIPHPIRTYNLPTGELLMGTFSALTADQAKDNLWEPFKGFVDAAPWFQGYHAFLKEQSKKHSIEFLKDLTTFLFYGHKKILFHFTGSQDKKLRGRTRIYAAIDELGWMTTEESKSASSMMNADATYTALSNSLATMRIKTQALWDHTSFDLPPVLMVNASSPSSAKDKIMRLVKDSQVNPKILAYNLPTWEMNPDYTFESLREEFAHVDDLTFNRDFGAEPPLSDKPFLTEARFIDKLATAEPLKSVYIEIVEKVDPFGDVFKTVKPVFERGHMECRVPRILSADLGHTKNAFGLTVLSLHEGKPKLDLAMAIIPEKKKRIGLSDVFENFILPLCAHLNIGYAFFDRWQSLVSMEALRQKGVDAQIYSVNYAEMDAVRSAILSQGIVFQKMSRPLGELVQLYLQSEQKVYYDHMANLGIQLLTVRDFGTKIGKPLTGDDDLFRALALGVTKVSDKKVREFLEKGPTITPSGHNVKALATVRIHSEFARGSGRPAAHMNLVGEDGKPLCSVRSRRGKNR
jgi:hypothetical protein